MTKADLKGMIAELDNIGAPDSVLIKIKMAADNSLIDLQPQAFDVMGRDASYSLDAGGHWAAVVSMVDSVVFKQ